MGRNIGVIGCGYWGRNLVRNLAGLGALHTICDVVSSKLEDCKSFYPEVNTETDYRKLLTNQAIEGIVIATPAASHYSIAREALLSGKDVLVEKPLALNVEQGVELVELADRQRKVLLVGHLLEYHPAVTRLKELVDGGELGKIQYIYSNRLNLGKFRTEENILWSFAPHDVSLILLLLGGEMPEEISVHGGYYLHQDIADVTMSVLNFKNGVKAHIFVSWLHPYKEQRLVVIGDRKMALFDDTNPDNKLFLYSHEIDWVERRPVPRRKQPVPVVVPPDEPLKLECQDFLDCIHSRRKPKVDGHKGLQVLQVLTMCQKSLQEGGRTITLKRWQENFFADETSILEEPCHVGEGTKIWHFCHVMPGVTIGKNCTIGQNVFIGRGVKVGNNVKIENNVSVFEGVTLEDGVFCGPSCVFTNVVNPRSQYSRRHEFKSTLVREGVTIGANATIICGNTIGRYAFVGAGAVVTHDVPDYALVYGNPARVQGWVCECGERLNFESDAIATCSQCQRRYRRREDRAGATVERLQP
ncbi:MAG TPA: oxidoreductase [Dehalococcoidia bacterium]|nr:oxidoreductase [Dehalococcoidia bacterium]